MYSPNDLPKSSRKSESRLSLSITLSNESARSLNGKVITAFMSEKAFKNMGYRNSTGALIPCCDEEAAREKKCELNKLIIPQSHLNQVHMRETDISKTSTIDVMSEISQTGMYYVVAAVCDPSITPHTKVSGMMTAEIAYGHLPATQYYSLPFFSWMSLIYVFALIVWGMLCIQYSKEIMSVHLMILIVLVFFVINCLMKVLYLWIYNSTGSDTFIYPSVFIDVITRTLTRVLTLLVCMGLGVSRASISDVTLKMVLFSIVYFGVNLFDSLLSLQQSISPEVNNLRVYITAGLDALVYFWVFHSLMNTMDDLRQNKQHAKLAVFIRLYALLLISVVVSTATLILFSYLINNPDIKDLWKYQWFMNEGIWSIYYLVLFVCLMYMWKPSENASAYAYHSELATDIQEDEEEYGLPQNKLESGDEGEVVVNPATADLKPMSISEGTTQA